MEVEPKIGFCCSPSFVKFLIFLGTFLTLNNKKLNMSLKVTLNNNRNLKNIVVLLDIYHLSPTCHACMHLIIIKSVIYMIISGPNNFFYVKSWFSFILSSNICQGRVCVGGWQSMFDITVTCYLHCPDS